MTRSSTGIDDYLNEISRYPLLTAQEEISLGRQVQRMMELKELERDLTSDEKREVRRGERALQKFVRANLKLVVSAAKRYMHVVRTMDLMDLVQEGNIGLIRGVEKFDPARGYKFSTYAYWWIRQSINRAIATKERAVRLPGKAQELATSWNTAMRNLHNDLGRAPRIEEIAAYFKVAVAEIEHFMRVAMAPVASLDRVMRDDSNMSLGDTIEDPNNIGGADGINKAIAEEYTAKVENAYSVAYMALTDKERELLERKWGLHGKKPETLVEIGNSMDVSRERVRQLLVKAQNKMKVRLSANEDFRQAYLAEHQVAPPVAAWSRAA